MRFLIDQDYIDIIDQDELEVLTEGSLSILRKAELRAVEKIKKILARQYDTSKLFIEIGQFKEGATHYFGKFYAFTNSEGETIIYECLETTTESPEANEAVWVDNDPRDITLIEYSIYFALYILYSKVAKRTVPEDRYEQYKEARDFFTALQQDEITVHWERLKNEEGTEESPLILYGKPKTYKHYY